MRSRDGLLVAGLVLAGLGLALFETEDALYRFASIGSGLCIVLWLVALWRIFHAEWPPSLRVARALTILVLVAFDVIVISALAFGVRGDPLRYGIAFIAGMQIVAALAVYLTAEPERRDAW